MLRYRHKLVPNVSELPSEMSKLLYDVGKVLKFSRQNSKITTTYYYCYWVLRSDLSLFPGTFIHPPWEAIWKLIRKVFQKLCFIIILKYSFMMVFTKKLPFFFILFIYFLDRFTFTFIFPLLFHTKTIK